MTARKAAIAAILLIGAVLLQSCNKGPAWNAKDISGLMPPLAFNLVDESGRHVTAADYRGKIVLLFFGYTNCPDYCPTTLARLASVLDKLPNERNEVQILFVSVDPRRDDPQRLALYTSNFAPEIIGLTGTEPALRELAKRYRTTFSYGKPNKLGNYEVTHGLAVYVFDRTGKARLMILDTEGAQQVATDLKRLVAGSA